MKRWRVKRLYQLIFKPTTRQIAAAIRLGIRIGEKREHTKTQIQPFVWICEHCKKKAYEQSAWNTPPEPKTDKPRAYGARQRAFTRQLQEQLSGTLMNHHKEMQARKEAASDEPLTEQMPNAPRPTRKLNFTRLLPDDSWLT